MPKWKFAVLFCLCVLLSIAQISPVRAEGNAPLSPPTVSAKSAALLEVESGDVIFQKDAETPLPMASTTKIMTALVALEMADPDTVITVPAAAVGTEGSSVYLIEGERLTLEELLYALMLESANDAAVAIAVGLAGSIEDFAIRMNDKAKALGLTNTHFENPHGLDSEGHRTTALELALIARHALENDVFRRIVSTHKTTIPHAGTDGVRLLVNHNKMLRIYDGCIGVKTGFTSNSGRCLVSAAERDGVTVIAVTLSAPSDWDDHKKLLDYGFSRYVSTPLCKAGEYQLSLPLIGGKDEYVMLANAEGLSRTLPVSHPPIQKTVEMRRFEYAPITQGDTLGRVVFSCDLDRDGAPERIGEVALTASYTVERKQTKRTFWQWLCSLFGF